MFRHHVSLHQNGVPLRAASRFVMHKMQREYVINSTCFLMILVKKQRCDVCKNDINIFFIHKTINEAKNTSLVEIL